MCDIRKMSTTYILEKLGEIKSSEERRKEAVRLFRCFDDRIPSGDFNPPMHGDYFDNESIRRSIQETELFYVQVGELCGGELPVEIRELHKKFQKDSARTEELLRLPTEQQRKLETHERFPFWSDFNGAIHKYFKDGWSRVDLEKITFSPSMIGKGGFATLYEATDGERKYALKLFHPPEKYHIGLGERSARRRACAQIAENIAVNKEILSMEPFAVLRAYPYTGSHDPITCYLMDFIPGKTVDALLENKVNLTRETVGKVLLTYAQMLASLHSQKKLFVDNNWGAVIVNEREIRICDYDFITAMENVASDEFHTFQARYGSREHYLSLGLRQASELEQFALMVDHLLIGRNLLSDEQGFWRKNEETATLNKRRYSVERRAKLPRQLAQLVSAMISYPRDDSIIANDFVTAVKEDYGL